jgi:hypothetical protein
MKYAFYCPACKSFWQAESSSNAAIENCLNCGNHPYYTGYTAEAWKALDQSSKDEVCARLATRQNIPSEPTEHPHLQKSVWMRLVRTQGWFIFAIMVIFAITIASQMVDEQPFLSFLIVAAAIVLGLFTVAFIMMFVDMAVDLRATRRFLTGTANDKNPPQ